MLELHQIADRLHEAEIRREPIEPLHATYPGLTLEQAYEIQSINAARQLKGGHRFIGYKVGLTSLEAQKYFGVSEPDFGHLFDSMAIEEGGEVDLSQLIQPKIEGEIAFVLGKNLKGPGLTLIDAVSAVDYALVSMEIVDSRIRDWKIKAVDTIADNGSSARFVLSGSKHKIDSLDLPFVGMALSRNGEVLITGAGAAVMGNPLAAVSFLANELGKAGHSLLAGQVILSGSLSSMVTMRGGDVITCEMGGLGRVSVRVKGVNL